MKQTLSSTVVSETTSHSTKPASWQVAGYPAEAGIQLFENHRVAGQHDFVCYAVFFSCWIPACAGMTAS
jgi:hypothetical protein